MRVRIKTFDRRRHPGRPPRSIQTEWTNAELYLGTQWLYCRVDSFNLTTVYNQSSIVNLFVSSKRNGQHREERIKTLDTLKSHSSRLVIQRYNDKKIDNIDNSFPGCFIEQLISLPSPQEPTHLWRSSSQLLLYQPATRINFQSKAFSITAPAVWNSLSPVT